MYNFVFPIVHDLQVETPQRTAAVPGTAVVILNGEKNFLTLVIFDRVFVVRLETNKCCELPT